MSHQLMKVRKSEPSLVRPAEETEKGLFTLTNTDHLLPMIVKTLYSFKHGGQSQRPSDVLRKALAKVLVHYHPLAGRLEKESDGKYVVNCTGEGAVFVEAEADCTLEDVCQLEPHNLSQLIHQVPGQYNLLETPLLVAQVTDLKCGGFTLGLCLSHCVVDGKGAMEFVNSWGETARGIPLTVPPILDRTLLKPRNPPRIDYQHLEFSRIQDISRTEDLYRSETMVYKSFCFDQEKLERLKARAKEDGAVEKCTTFEALAAFSWRARSKALRLLPEQETKLLILVDGRSRFEPPLPKGYFGNGITVAWSVCESGELLSKPFSAAVGLVQGGIKMANDRYMRSAIDYFEVNREKICFSSALLIAPWSRLGFNVVDFGWGGSVMSGLADLPVKEVVLFLSNGAEMKGITLLLGLPALAMNTFEQQFLDI